MFTDHYVVKTLENTFSISSNLISDVEELIAYSASFSVEFIPAIGKTREYDL